LIRIPPDHRQICRLERRASRGLKLIEDGDFAVSVEVLDGLIEPSRTSIVSHGIGPGRTSLPTKIRSTAAARTSARTASSAGRLP
jgi:hypothetical protein